LGHDIIILTQAFSGKMNGVIGMLSTHDVQNSLVEAFDQFHSLASFQVDHLLQVKGNVGFETFQRATNVIPDRKPMVNGKGSTFRLPTSRNEICENRSGD
jgi:hypothetical protein